MRQGVLGLLLLLSPIFASGLSVSAPLRAGIATVDITPRVGAQLAGPDKRRLAERVHDSLSAKLLVLKTPEASVALVASDLYKLQSSALVKRMHDELGIAHTILL